MVCAELVGQTEREVIAQLNTSTTPGCHPNMVGIHVCVYVGILLAGMDFQPLAIELTFSALDRILCANITILDDEILENNETFTVQLSSNDPDAIVAVPQSTVTIIDDDGMSNWLTYFVLVMWMFSYRNKVNQSFWYATFLA